MPLRATHRRCQGDDRAGRPVRFRQAPGDIRRSRAVGAVDEGRAASHAGIAVGHVDRRGFGPSEQLADAGCLQGDPQRVVAAGHEEQALDPEGLELGCRRDGSGHLRRGRLHDRRRHLLLPGAISGLDVGEHFAGANRQPSRHFRDSVRRPEIAWSDS